jgi:DNA adenine methylase
MKPPFIYFGAKTSLAERVVSLLPPHRHYVEPFAGSLAVLLAKPRSLVETVNDLDDDLVTFWRVLRDHPEQLARARGLTPHSRAEHVGSYDLHGLGDVERARRVWVRLNQGRGGLMRRSGWRFYRDADRASGAMAATVNAYAERLLPTAERIAGVSLECRPALDVIATYGDHPSVLLYVDPPYLGATRSSGRQYRHEMHSEAEHAALADALNGANATVVLSGYPSPLYDRLYDGWHRYLIPHHASNAGIGRTARTEALWCNRPWPHTLPLDLASA